MSKTFLETINLKSFEHINGKIILFKNLNLKLIKEI